MLHIIPTHRPFLTPLRAAIAIAVAALASGLFLVFGEARSEESPSAPAALACPDHTAARHVI